MASVSSSPHQKLSIAMSQTSASGSLQQGQHGIKRIQMILAEGLGAMVITMVHTLSVANPIAIGLSILVTTYVFRHVSFGHFNPAISLAAAIRGQLDWVQAGLHVCVQVVAAGIGALIAYSIAGDVVCPGPKDGSTISLLQAGAMELLYTMLIVVVYLSATTVQQTKRNWWFGLATGLAKLAATSVGLAVSGGVFNAATALALQFVSQSLVDTNCMDASYAYWIAAVLAGAGGAFFVTLLHKDVEGPDADELEPSFSLLSIILMEMFGTFFLTLTASLGSFFGVGSMLCCLVYAGGHVSGAEYNPAVTVGVALRFRAPVKDYARLVIKVVGQVVAGLLAGVVSYGIAGKVGYPHPDGFHGVLGAFVFESIFTCFLVLTVLCVATPTSEVDVETGTDSEDEKSYFGMAIGFMVSIGAASAGMDGGGSGGVFNPAVGSGLLTSDALFQGHNGSSLWIYWFGPLLGSVIAAGLFSLLHSRQERFGYRPL